MSAQPQPPPAHAWIPEHDIAERPFPLYATDVPLTKSATPVATSRWATTAEDPVNRAFFSQQNVDAIQRSLRDTIKRQTGYVIDRQSDDQLLIVMRYVYLLESRNTGGGAEVTRLNALVVKEVAPQVASGVLQYLAYLRDASRLPTPIPRAQATSIKGTTTADLFRPV